LKTRGAAVWPQEVIRARFRCVLLVALPGLLACSIRQKTQGVPVSTRFPHVNA
jgi:hypothetical protein